MEQPPGSVDDLQPQDLSTSSVPTVIDLTRKGEECVVNATSLDGLRMVKSPGWFPNSAGVNPGLLSETSLSESGGGGGGGDGSSDITLQSGDHDHIQPDNAFSHTTVTLSYVSRSRVFSTPDPISRHSPLSTVGKFSLHPACDADKGLGETGYSLNQHYLEQVEGPVDLAAQTELLQSLSQDQVGPEDDGGVCVTQEPHEVNGGVVSSDGDMDKHIQEEEQSEHSPSWKNSSSLENGGRCSRSSSGLCAESSPETLTPAAVEEEEEEEEKGDPEVLFLTKKQDPVVVGDSVGARDLCSLSREYISPLEDPVSPSATSLDGVEDVFVLPQTSSSPSGDNSYLETAEVEEEAVVVVWDGPRTEEAIQPTAGISDHATRLDSSVENKKPAHRRKAVLEPLIDLTDDASVSSIVEEDKPKTVVPHMNGNSKALQRALKAKKLPQRSSRGTRLEAIVMNINSSRYKVSGCIRTNHNKASASQSTVSDSNLADPERNDTVAVGKRNSRVRTSFSTKTVKQKAKPPVTRGKTNNINTDSCKDSTSDSELLSNSKMSLRSTPPKSPQPAMHKRSKKEPEDVSHPVRSPQTTPTKSKNKPSSPSSPHKNSTKQPELLSQPEEIHVARFSPSPSPLSSKSPKKSPGKAKGQAAGSKTPPTAKTKVARTPRRRRKKLKGGQSSSMFSPKEPEIKLKYVNYKEEKRDRSDSFSPFIRVERQQSSPSLCTIINYPEEVRAQHKKGQQQAHTTGYMSAVVPSTSCLQLGRASNHSQHQRALVCCLCGRSANAMDLGDLHGPYYPEGYQVPSAKTPTSIKEDEDDYTDSDSSSCSVRGGRRRRKCAVPPPTAPPSWSFRQGAQLKQKGLLENHDSGVSSPAVKRARMDAVSTDVEDWYSPPMLPLEPCEYWLHEDCGIWSVGVFLVKGKVYGLEEAVRVAQETMCSACRDPGATLGCFFKGCPNKYHYRCALESDCVLIEENFSMKCKKHKNKTFKAPPGNRWDDR